MNGPDDLGFWNKVAVGASSVAVALVGVVWGGIKHRLNKHDDHIEKLYVNAETDRRLVRDLHDDAMKEIRELHRDMIEAITRSR